MRVIVFLFIFTAGFLFGSSDLNFWEHDFAKSVALSQKEDKALLLFYTGSDWSGPSMKMKKEILDDKAFREALKESFVFVEIDFPMHHELSEELRGQNRALKEQFNVTHFPCVLILDQTKREITRLDYVPEKKEQFASKLLSLVALDRKLHAALALLSKGVTLNGHRLKELYGNAQELGQPHYLAALLEAGMKSEERRFFMIHGYRNLVQKGLLREEQTKLLRKELMAGKEEESCYSLVLIDFQELSRSKVESQEVIAPLMEYLAYFEESGAKNVWRIEMMLAQVFMSYDHYHSAYEYAKRAYEKAPVACKGEIAESLSYIEAQTSHLVGQ